MFPYDKKTRESWIHDNKDNIEGKVVVVTSKSAHEELQIIEMNSAAKSYNILYLLNIGTVI